MAGETIITLVGNLVADPDLRFTPANNTAVAKFKVASTSRTFDRQTQEWKEGDSLFITCSAWRGLAENVAESLTKGTRVVVTGRLRQRSFEGREGEKVTVLEMDVDEVGPSLRYATAKVTRASSSSSNGGGGSWQGGASSAPASDWSSAPASGTDNDPWANAQSDEPPF